MIDDTTPGRAGPPPPGPVFAAPPPAPPRSQLQPGLALGLVAAGVVIGVLCSTVGAGALWLATRSGSGHRTTALPNLPAPVPAPTAEPHCDWLSPQGQVARNVGTPPPSPRRSGTVTMTVTTNLGVIEIRMDRSKTPCTVASFEFLTGKKYFDGSPCHRLTTKGIFVLQCGDPSGAGTGGPAYRYADENLPGPSPSSPYTRGTVAMANAGPDTNGSQFFINYADEPPDLTGDYPLIGTVVRGMDIVDRVAAGGCDDPTGEGDGVPKTRIEIRSVAMTG